jgi:hypothetical protein
VPKCGKLPGPRGRTKCTPGGELPGPGPVPAGGASAVSRAPAAAGRGRSPSARQLKRDGGNLNSRHEAVRARSEPSMLLVLLLLLARPGDGGSRSPVPGLVTEYGCEGSTVVLACPAGRTIRVVRANYGRSGSGSFLGPVMLDPHSQ